MTFAIDWIGGVPRTNFMTGRYGNPATIVIDHWMAGSFDSAVARFRQYGTIVSAHYLIRQDGYIAQMVRDDDTAYHAGDWDTNLISIGIEHEASPTIVPSDALYAASAWLHARLAGTHGIHLVLGETVKPHNAIVPTKCPGTLDIARILREAGSDMAFATDPDAQQYVKEVAAKFDALNQVMSDRLDRIEAALRGINGATK
jgi:hypothetical protein